MESYTYFCECSALPHHPIPGMTTELYHKLTLLYGTEYLIQAPDCQSELVPGHVVIAQADTYRVVGPARRFRVTLQVLVSADNSEHAVTQALDVLNTDDCAWEHAIDITELEPGE